VRFLAKPAQRNLTNGKENLYGVSRRPVSKPARFLFEHSKIVSIEGLAG
jgi:hypothetical protein